MQNILLAFEVLLGLGVIVTIYMQPSKSDALSGLIQGSTQEYILFKKQIKN